MSPNRLPKQKRDALKAQVVSEVPAVRLIGKAGGRARSLDLPGPQQIVATNDELPPEMLKRIVFERLVARDRNLAHDVST